MTPPSLIRLRWTAWPWFKEELSPAYAACLTVCGPPINFETPIAYICCKRYLLDSKGECVINEKKFERTQISRCVHRNQMKFRIADPTA